MNRKMLAVTIIMTLAGIVGCGGTVPTPTPPTHTPTVTATTTIIPTATITLSPTPTRVPTNTPTRLPTVTPTTTTITRSQVVAKLRNALLNDPMLISEGGVVAERLNVEVQDDKNLMFWVQLNKHGSPQDALFVPAAYIAIQACSYASLASPPFEMVGGFIQSASGDDAIVIAFGTRGENVTAWAQGKLSQSAFMNAWTFTVLPKPKK